MRSKWREVDTYNAPKMEEHMARRAGFTLRVRGPRGGSSWRWTIDRVVAGQRETVKTGVCVEWSVAMSRAEFWAEKKG